MPWMMLTNKWLVGGVALIGLALALWVQTTRLDAAQKAAAAAGLVTTQWRANFNAMSATNTANVAALEKLKAEAARIEGVARAARSANAKFSTDIETLRRNIRHALPTDDGPVRPVLCTTVNELRRLAAQPGPACGG